MSDSKGAAIIKSIIVVAAAKYHNALLNHQDLTLNESTDKAIEALDEAEKEFLALLAQEVKEAQDNIVAFVEYLNEGTLEERKAKIEAAKEWNKNRPDKERLG